MSISIFINDIAISSKPEFYIENSLNSHIKWGKISLSSANIGDACMIVSKKNNQDFYLIDGTIIDQDNHYYIIAEKTLTKISETFVDIELRSVLEELGSIEFHSKDINYQQIVLNQKTNLDALFQTHSLLTKESLFYSVYYRDNQPTLIVRSTPDVSDNKKFCINSVVSVGNNSITCIPIAGIEVGDYLVIDKVQYTVSKLKTSRLYQEIEYV